MKITVFSDTHGRIADMYDAVEREKPDAVIHLGDCTEDAQVLAHSYSSIPVYYVRGNNDYDFSVPLNRVVAPGGVPMYLTHGHMERVSRSSFGRLRKAAAQENCVLALFGHTHRVCCEAAEGIIMLNPGSISLPRGGPASYMRLTVCHAQATEITALRADGTQIQKYL